jgi:hypothetical protein
MLKQACMELGTSYCHRLISQLCVGDSVIIVTLATIAVCEALLVRFLWRSWRTRSQRTITLHPRTYGLGSRRAGSANLDASPS